MRKHALRLAGLVRNRVDRHSPVAVDWSLARDLGTVTTGQLAAQLISFAAIPVITRIYDPHAIGIQGIYLSIVNLVMTFAAFNLPLAVVLPGDDARARALVRLSIYVSLAVALALEAVLLVGGGTLLGWLGAEEIAPYRHLLAVSVAVGSTATALSYYFIRQGLYGDQARIQVANTVILNGGRIGLGAVSPVAVNLILANVAGTCAGLLQYALRWRKRFGRLFVSDRPGELLDLVRTYRDFPLLRTPQVLINQLSQVLPVWLLARFFGPASAGQYAIALALLAAPTALIGKAVGDVFYQRLAAAERAGGSVRALVVKATLAALALAVVPFALVAAAGPAIFEFVYGPQWGRAGLYAQWLAFWCMLQLVNKPAVAAVPVLNIQGGLLVYEVFSTASKVAALWFGLAVLGDDLAAVALFSLAGIAAYVILIGWVIVRSGGSAVQREAGNGR